MKKVLLTLALILAMILPAMAQDRTVIRVGAVGLLGVDASAPQLKPGAGWFMAIDQQVSNNLMVGVSYTASKLAGKADFSTLNAQSASAISRYFLKPLDTASKFNFYLLSAGGWTAVKTESGTDNGIVGIIGGGFTYVLYSEFKDGVRKNAVSLQLEPAINSLSNDATTFSLSAGLSFLL